MTTDSKNYCRSDATLGHAARMLLLGVCTPGSGYSDWDIPQAVWQALGVEMEAWLAANEADLVLLDLTSREVGEHWAGSRNGEGPFFLSLVGDYDLTNDEVVMLSRLQHSAKSQGECNFYMCLEDAKMYYNSGPAGFGWVLPYEAAREVYCADEG